MTCCSVTSIPLFFTCLDGVQVISVRHVDPQYPGKDKAFQHTRSAFPCASSVLRVFFAGAGEIGVDASFVDERWVEGKIG